MDDSQKCLTASLSVSPFSVTEYKKLCFEDHKAEEGMCSYMDDPYFWANIGLLKGDESEFQIPRKRVKLLFSSELSEHGKEVDLEKQKDGYKQDTEANDGSEEEGKENSFMEKKAEPTILASRRKKFTSDTALVRKELSVHGWDNWDRIQSNIGDMNKTDIISEAVNLIFRALRLVQRGYAQLFARNVLGVEIPKNGPISMGMLGKWAKFQDQRKGQGTFFTDQSADRFLKTVEISSMVHKAALGQIGINHVKSPPLSNWTDEDDYSLLAGTEKWGFGNYDEMFNDETLVFVKKLKSNPDQSDTWLKRFKLKINYRIRSFFNLIPSGSPDDPRKKEESGSSGSKARSFSKAGGDQGIIGLEKWREDIDRVPTCGDYDVSSCSSPADEGEERGKDGTSAIDIDSLYGTPNCVESDGCKFFASQAFRVGLNQLEVYNIIHHGTVHGFPHVKNGTMWDYAHLEDVVSAIGKAGGKNLHVTAKEIQTFVMNYIDSTDPLRDFPGKSEFLDRLSFFGKVEWLVNSEVALVNYLNALDEKADYPFPELGSRWTTKAHDVAVLKGIAEYGLYDLWDNLCKKVDSPFYNAGNIDIPSREDLIARIELNCKRAGIIPKLQGIRKTRIRLKYRKMDLPPEGTSTLKHLGEPVPGWNPLYLNGFWSVRTLCAPGETTKRKYQCGIRKCKTGEARFYVEDGKCRHIGDTPLAAWRCIFFELEYEKHEMTEERALEYFGLTNPEVVKQITNITQKNEQQNKTNTGQ